MLFGFRFFFNLQFCSLVSKFSPLISSVVKFQVFVKNFIEIEKIYENHINP